MHLHWRKRNRTGWRDWWTIARFDRRTGGPYAWLVATLTVTNDYPMRLP